MKSHLDMKLGQSMKGELKVEMIKINNRKAKSLDKISLKYGRQGNLMTYFFDYAMQSINKTQKRNR